MRVLRSFCCALGFLTRIPVPAGWCGQGQEFRAGSCFFPLIGLLLGGITGGLWFLLRQVLAAPVLAALLLAVSVFLTGGLHLDGLMDTVDGVYGGRSRDQRLALMKDSRVGAFGAIAMALVLLLKYSLYTQLNPALLPYLILAPVLGRQALVWALVTFPYARQQGLGSLFSIYGDYRKLMITTGITLFLLVALLRWNGIGIFIIGGLCFYLVAGWLSRLLGGLTGDTYGALSELAEILVLLLGVLAGGIFR
jgi:adenosylcobinamide-GDP ribazoletransferase